MYQHFDSDLMSDFDEDGFDEYDADYAAPPASPNRSVTPAQRNNWNRWIRGLQHESIRNDARQAREAFRRSVEILQRGNRGGNRFDDFDAWDEDFDAASPSVRRQRARAEQQRRRRLAQQQRRNQRQQSDRQQRQRRANRSTTNIPSPPPTVRVPPEQYIESHPDIHSRPTVRVPITIPPDARPSGRTSFDAYDEYDEYFDDFDAWDEEADAAIGQGLRNLWGRFHRAISPTRRLLDAQNAHPPARRRIGFRRPGDPETITDPPPPPPGMRRRIGFRRPGDPEYIPDTFDALEDLADWAEGDAAIDAPTIARLTIRNLIPGASRLSHAMRQQLTRSVTSATRMLTGRQGAQAARAIPQIVARVQRNARRHRLPVQALPQAIRRTTARVANSPNLVRRLSQASPSRTLM